MVKKTTVKDVRDATIPEKLRKRTHVAAPTSPGTMSKVWETVKKLWLKSEKKKGVEKYHQRPTSLNISKEADIDLEKACDATKNLAKEGYLTINPRWGKKHALFPKQKIKPVDLEAKYEAKNAREE